MTDYEKEYQENAEACGQPFAEFVAFFDTIRGANMKVLDLGCGQGRDALMIGRKGHAVLGVDLSPTGIRQMLEQAQVEDLKVEGVVADLTQYQTKELYDVVLLDRVLHMFDSDEQRRAVLKMSCKATQIGGHILIADTPTNQSLIRSHFNSAEWMSVLTKKNLLFMQRI